MNLCLKIRQKTCELVKCSSRVRHMNLCLGPYIQNQTTEMKAASQQAFIYLCDGAVKHGIPNHLNLERNNSRKQFFVAFILAFVYYLMSESFSKSDH